MPRGKPRPGKIRARPDKDAPRGLISASEIIDMDLPEPEWVIEDVLPGRRHASGGEAKEG